MRLAIIAALGACVGSARADDGPASSIGGGLTIRGATIGSAASVGAGGFVDATVRRGDLALAGVASAQTARLAIGDATPPVDGLLLTAGAALRWTAGRFEPERYGDRRYGIDLRLDLGAELESYAWDGGGRLTRPGVFVGAATQFDFGRVSRRARGEVTIGLRLGLARPHTTAAVSRAACRGACTPTPAPVAYDAAWAIVLGGAWGR
ncbi:MAG: hypothetical protein JNK64_00265 [Myxococcales bacterium]|nr:hypothetical protein [Myxococcales bacterium]